MYFNEAHIASRLPQIHKSDAASNILYLNCYFTTFVGKENLIHQDACANGQMPIYAIKTQFSLRNSVPLQSRHALDL